MSVKIPKYRFHRGSGQALVQINGERIYLGVYDSPESHEQYRRILAEYLATGKGPNTALSSNGGLTIDSLIPDYFKFAIEYYQKDGKPTNEIAGIKTALTRLRKLFGRSAASDFGPKALKTVRLHMIDLKWSRSYVNKQIVRLKKIFQWGTADELISSSVYYGLKSVSGLKRGRSNAIDHGPVKPVPQAHIDAVIDHVPPEIAALIQLQLFTAARPSELVHMRPIDINTTGKIWLHSPQQHKTAHHVHSRTRLSRIQSPFQFRGTPSRHSRPRYSAFSLRGLRTHQRAQPGRPDGCPRLPVGQRPAGIPNGERRDAAFLRGDIGARG